MRVTQAEFIANAIIRHYKRKKKFEEEFVFDKGTRRATKDQVIELLKAGNIEADYNQIYNERSNTVRPDYSVILIGRYP